MVGSLGTGPQRRPRQVLDTIPVINCHHLHREGLIQPDTTSIILAVDGGPPIRVSIFRDYKPQYGYGSSQPGFLCPRCARRVWRLYVKDACFVCRHCMGVGYACQYVNRWSPDLQRCIRLRRKLKAELVQFGSLPPRPDGRGATMYDRLVQQVADCENRILGVLGNINVALGRRAKRGRR
jgi:hypothetical protein